MTQRQRTKPAKGTKLPASPIAAPSGANTEAAKPSRQTPAKASPGKPRSRKAGSGAVPEAAPEAAPALELFPEAAPPEAAPGGPEAAPEAVPETVSPAPPAALPGEAEGPVDRQASMLALADLIDRRQSGRMEIDPNSPSEQYMFTHGVPIEEIIRQREATEALRLELEGHKAVEESGAAKSTRAPGGAAKPRASKNDNKAIVWLIPKDPNPNREGSLRFKGFLLLRDCATTADFASKGGTPDVLRWALYKKWIELKEIG